MEKLDSCSVEPMGVMTKDARWVLSALMVPGTLYLALCYRGILGGFLRKEQFKLNGKEAEPSTHKAQTWGEEDGALRSKRKDCTDRSQAEYTVVARAHTMW